MLLTDEEIQWFQDSDSRCNNPSTSLIIKGAIAKAQLKKVVEWGDELCDDETHNGYGIVPPTIRRKCSLCWQALLEEVKE